MKIQPIVLKRGENRQLILPGYSTSGFEWNIKNTDDKIVAISKSFKRDASHPGIVGKSPEEVFQIKGLSAGKVQLIFELKRSWEKLPKEIKEFRIIIE